MSAGARRARRTGQPRPLLAALPLGSGGGLNCGGLFASWELDIWGRVRSGREVRRMQLLSAAIFS